MEFPIAEMGKLLNTIIGVILLISGCSSKVVQESAFKNGGIYSTADYVVSAPSGFTYSEFAPSQKYYYFGYPNSSETKLSTIGIYQQASCPLTPSHMEDIQKSKNIIWGKVVYKPSNDPAGDENTVFCPPLKPAISAYAFCAIKGSKAVAICIQQMTDDPKMAEDIFKTFRWKK